MANLQELVNTLDTTDASKKATKSTLNFNTEKKAPKKAISKATIKTTTIPKDKEVAVSIETVKEVKVAKEPNLAVDINHPTQVKEVNTSTLPVEEQTQQAIIKRNLDRAAKEKAEKQSKKAVAHGTAVHKAIHKSIEDPLPKDQQPVKGKQVHPRKQDNISKDQFFKPNNTRVNGREVPPSSGTYAEHLVGVSLIIKNNAEIRRFTSLGILNYLLQKGEVRGKGRYVNFKWNKFVVKVNNIVKEYEYSEPFFLNCFVASFASFAASAQRAINALTLKELDTDINGAISPKMVDEIHQAMEERELNGK